MKHTMGWLTYGLAVAFAALLLLAMAVNAWFKPLPDGKAFAAFFGFGIPALIAGGFTASLWAETGPVNDATYSPGAQITRVVLTEKLGLLGWSCVVYSILHGICLVVAMVGIVWTNTEVGFGEALSFAVPMALTGFYGMWILSLPQPAPTKEHASP